MSNFSVTTPIYYVNGYPHVGHAYTTIVADVIARYQRVLGDDVHFLTGTDEHGQKVQRSAAVSPEADEQRYVDNRSGYFRSLWDRMGITYTDFIRTTDPRHVVGVQKLFRTLYDKGYIYLAKYTGSYCVSCEIFVEVAEGSPCPDCDKPVNSVEEENFFFKLSAFQEPLLELIESHALLVTPKASFNEVVSFLRGGLKDLSISRSNISWGIPVPEDIQRSAGATQPHVIYVWLDALANYITALGYGSPDEKLLAKFWPNNIHLVGKEITRFHCIYWPAFLMAAGLPLPNQVAAHGWLLVNDSKMSKSTGNGIRPESVLDILGNEVYGKGFPDSTPSERDLFASDVLRYYLLSDVVFGQDGSFNLDTLVTRYNADLANGYGNLVSRVLSMIGKYFRGVIPPKPDKHYKNVDASLPLFYSFMDTNQFHKALEFLFRWVRELDGYINYNEPWKVAAAGDVTQLSLLLYNCVESLRIITGLLYPFLPYSTGRVWGQLGLGDIEQAAKDGTLANLKWGQLEPTNALNQISPLFPRSDKHIFDI